MKRVLALFFSQVLPLTVFASVIAAAVYLLLARLARSTAEPASLRRVAVQ